MNKIDLSIIIPVYNEEKTILEILKRVNDLKSHFNLEIIIIDDGSIDSTKLILKENKELYSKSLFLEKNSGKGAAVIQGIKMCTHEYIAIQDADLEYIPSDLKMFSNKIYEINAELIMGSRFIGNNRSVLHFWHMLGNKFITFLFNIINNTTFTDIYCCYCMFKKNLIDYKKLQSLGWGQQAEILTYLVHKSKKNYEIGVNYDARNYNEGKKIRYHHVFGVCFWIFFTKIKIFFKK